MTFIRVLALAACLVAGLAHATPAPAIEDWRSFDSEIGRFRVDLPGTPGETQKERWFPVSNFVSRVYKVFVGEDIFGVNHTDIPGAALFFASEKKVFNSTRDGFLEDSNATEVSFTETDVVGRPGRELIYDIPAQGDQPALHGRALMCFEGNRLYVFYTEVTRSRAQADLDRFFDSIRIEKESD
jgi:hypothetical protein